MIFNARNIMPRSKPIHLGSILMSPISDVIAGYADHDSASSEALVSFIRPADDHLATAVLKGLVEETRSRPALEDGHDCHLSGGRNRA